MLVTDYVKQLRKDLACRRVKLDPYHPDPLAFLANRETAMGTAHRRLGELLAAAASPPTNRHGTQMDSVLPVPSAMVRPL